METAEDQLNDKWKIHEVIQEALKASHSEPSPQTMEMFKEQNKQLGLMSTDIAVIKQRGIDRDASIEEIKDLIKETNISVKEISEKVGIQNGRVTKIEGWSNEAKKIIDSNAEVLANYKTDKTKIYTAIAVCLLFIGTIGTLYYALVSSKLETLKAENKELIKSTVEAAFENYQAEVTIK